MSIATVDTTTASAGTRGDIASQPLALRSASESLVSGRLDTVDLARGLIVLFMAIDHVGALIVRRHSAEFWGGLWTRYETSDQLQFVLRFLSHLCAPGFFLWMGVGIALLAMRRSRQGWSTGAVVRFLVYRGLLLIAIGQFIETPAWLIGMLSAAPTHNSLMSALIPGGGGPIFIGLTVIFALGASMIVVGVLTPLISHRFWIWMLLGVSLLLICAALIPPATQASTVFALWERVLLIAGQTNVVYVEYPLLPWLAITCLGVATGQLLGTRYIETVRASTWAGVVLIFAALALRALAGFGNTRLPRDGTWVEFFNLIKYPPSLVFTLMMVGGNLLLFGLLSRIGTLRWKAGRALATLGRAPLFFYIAHLYLFAIVGALFFRQGTNYTIGLAVWAAGMVPLYYASAWFDQFKRAGASTSRWRML